jgi:hypothetical protein
LHVLTMLETHIMMSSLIFLLALIIMLCLALTLMLYLALTLMLCLISLVRCNHHLYGFGSRENCFEPRCFGYDLCPHRGDRFPHRPSFPAGGSRIYLDNPCFPHRHSRPTGPSGEVQRIVKTSSGRMVKCWIHKFYLTNPSTEPLTFYHSM